MYNFRSNTPVFIPNARRLPESVLSVSLIHKKRWIDPSKVHRYDYYGTIQKEIEDKKLFEKLYQKAKTCGKQPKPQI